MHIEADWIESLQLASGAITTFATPRDQSDAKLAVNPYFANFAALGLLEAGRLGPVERWIRWYVEHMNRPDTHGLTGTVYDYTVDPISAIESPTGDYDSVDSYASTFINLVLAYLRAGTGEPATAARTHAFVASLRDELTEVANVMIAIMDKDDLTWAKPGWMVKYVMDNSEVFSGFADAATLWTLVWPDDTATQTTWVRMRERSRTAIVHGLSDGDQFFVQLEQNGTRRRCDWSRWYADVTANVYPALWAVIDPADDSAAHTWAELNRHFPHWPELRTGDDFPWGIIGYAAIVMGDLPRARRFVTAVQAQIISTGRPPHRWYGGEAGWYIRILAALDRHAAGHA